MPSLSNHLGMHAAGSVHKEMLTSKAVGPPNPALWWVQSAVPLVLVLATCAPAWWPVLCEKLRRLRSAMTCQNLRRVIQDHWPEILGFATVAVAGLLGLMFGSGGYFSSHEELEKLKSVNAHVVEMRKFWPILLHPDSLILMQQLLRGLGACLLVYHGAAESGGGAFAPALMQLAAASGMRFLLWSSTSDYQPEGPLAGNFAIYCTALTFVAQIWAASKALHAASTTSWRSKKILGLQYVIQVVLCLWAAFMNHFTVGQSSAANVVFSAIDAADMSAAPIFTIAACVAASENAGSVAGAMHFMAAAQVMGFQWYLDFVGVLENPNSTDPFIRALLIFKTKLQMSVHGDPFALMTAGHIIQLSAMFVSSLASWGFFVGFFQNNSPKAAPKHVIEKLDLVSYTRDLFGDDDSPCCAICLGEFEENDQLRRLPCGHQQFHSCCVDHWLSKAGRCPLCVADVQPNSETKED